MQLTARNLTTISHWKQLSVFKRYRTHHINPQEGVSGTDLVLPDQSQKIDLPKTGKTDIQSSMGDAVLYTSSQDEETRSE